jgi:hypothetical protein
VAALRETFSKESEYIEGGIVPEVTTNRRLLQSAKADLPIVVTALMKIEVRPEQAPKAPSPIVVTESGMVIEVRLRQSSKA